MWLRFKTNYYKFYKSEESGKFYFREFRMFGAIGRTERNMVWRSDVACEVEAR